MVLTEAVDIHTPAGLLSAVIHLPERTPAPVVVCCHGLLSSKDSMKYVAVAEQFCVGGFAVVRFDFSGCGQSTASLAGSLLESRVRDLESVLGYVASRPWSKAGRTALFGSSLGGYLALLAAGSGKYDIGAVVCWATPFDLKKVELALERSEIRGRPFPGGFVLGSPRDLRSVPSVPRVLIVHGQKDEIVPWKEALSIYGQVGGSGRLLIMETADHRFTDPQCRRLAMKASLDWLRDNLNV